MKAIRQFFDKLEPHFEKGGKFEKYYALYEVFDTFFFSCSAGSKSMARVAASGRWSATSNRKRWMSLGATGWKVNPFIFSEW